MKIYQVLEMQDSSRLQIPTPKGKGRGGRWTSENAGPHRNFDGQQLQSARGLPCILHALISRRSGVGFRQQAHVLQSTQTPAFTAGPADGTQKRALLTESLLRESFFEKAVEQIYQRQDSSPYHYQQARKPLQDTIREHT